MSTVLDQLLVDLDAETSDLRAVVDALDDWTLPTPAEGWDVATSVAHLAWTEEVAVAAAGDGEAWAEVVRQAVASPETYVDDQAVALARVSRDELVLRWDAGRKELQEALRAREGKLPWFGPPMSPTSMATARLMETWAHGLDIRDAAGVVAEPTDRLRHVAHIGVRTRDFSFAGRGLTPPAEEFRVELSGPGGGEWGPADAAQRVTGTAWDFCRLAVQRVHREDTALVAFGQDASTWLDIAQCFAGAPGGGRSRG